MIFLDQAPSSTVEVGQLVKPCVTSALVRQSCLWLGSAHQAYVPRNPIERTLPLVSIALDSETSYERE